MPRLIVIHAGFHKTGTSTVQQVLRRNRPLLKPYMRSVLKGEMQALCHAARGYSTWRDPFTLDKFATRFAALLDRVGEMPKRALCLSAEELSGHMPGREGIGDYGAAPVLAAEMARVAAERHPGAGLRLYYSTRAPVAWLESAYWEHVKSSGLTETWEDFATRHRAAGGLDVAADAVADALAGMAEVSRMRLEDSAGLPAGPATPLLRLCGVPEAVLSGLALPPPVNERRDVGVLLALLAANRDYPDHGERQAAKRAILSAAQENTGDD